MLRGVDSRLFTSKCRRTDGQKDIQTDGRTDGQTDRPENYSPPIRYAGSLRVPK